MDSFIQCVYITTQLISNSIHDKKGRSIKDKYEIHFKELPILPPQRNLLNP